MVGEKRVSDTPVTKSQKGIPSRKAITKPREPQPALVTMALARSKDWKFQFTPGFGPLGLILDSSRACTNRLQLISLYTLCTTSKNAPLGTGQVNLTPDSSPKPSSMTDPPQDLLDEISGALASEGDVLQMILVTFIGLSCYNVAELVVLVPATFRRWRGLYFWSLLASGCIGVVPYSIGFLMKFFTRADSVLSVTVLTVGWWTMVTGQSVVLYSRLHLVLRDEKILRKVWWMIVGNVFLLHVPTTILTYGANVVHSGEIAWVEGYNIMEKIQLTGFTIQESLISTLYVIETVKLLRIGAESTMRPDARSIMYQLIGINCTIIAMDLLLLGLEYANFYAVQITLKGFIYSLKLKLEFAVLGRLVDLIQGSRHPISIAIADTLPLCSFTHQMPDQHDDQPEVKPKHREMVQEHLWNPGDEIIN